MAIPKIIGAQRDFSAGELDVAMKRADENPMMKIGARQALNWRILNSGAASNRPGRRILFLETGRVEKVLMSPGNTFFLVFGAGYLRVYNAAGANVFSSTVKGDGASAIPWTSATAGSVTFAVAAGSQLSIYIAYADGAPNNVPQVLTWDGVSQTSTWTLSTFKETIVGIGKKRTIFARISPQNVSMLPSNVTGYISIMFSQNILVAGMVGTRMAYCGRQILITGVSDGMHGSALVIEPLPPSQYLTEASTSGIFNLGDEIKGASSGATGIVISTPSQQVLDFDSVANFLVGDLIRGASSGATGTFITVDSFGGGGTVNLATNTLFVAGESVSGVNGTATIAYATGGTLGVQVIPSSSGDAIQFGATETVAGPSGSAVLSSVSTGLPGPVSIWDDEVMNGYRGYPASVFFDQNRLGLCNFPQQPAGISWSAIGLPTDLYVEGVGAAVTSSSAIYEFAPGKSQVLFVEPGMESSEFIFCDNAIYYLPITVQNPLQPGSVAFTLLSAQGCSANVRPQPAQQSILFVKAGGVEIGAVQAPGAYYRPYVVDNVSEFHSHLFTGSPPVALAVPPAPSQFEENYAYVLLADGSMVVGKYAIRQGLLDVGPDGKPKIGWLPWTGDGEVEWISALGGDLILTTNYPASGGSGFSNGYSSGFGGGGLVSVVETLDAMQPLDCALAVNALPTALAASGGKGPLWWLPSASVTLFDGARPMGTYQTDANGFIVPQFNGGENLASATLIAGQPWTSVLEPFVPDAPPGQSQHQRMFKRRVSRMAVYVSSSTGFLMARLFSGPITPATAAASLALGTVMNTFRVTTWNIGDNVEAAPPLREEAYRWRPLGRSYDPRMAVIKDTPGPLIIHEIGLEASL